MIRIFTLLILIAFSSFSLSASRISVVGLFPGAAILLINGERHVVKEGKSVAGVKLVSTTKNSATVSIGGQLRTLQLGRETSQDYVEPEKPVVKITRSKDGHYWVDGMINGRTVRMVLDTGATDISISEEEAKRIGLDYKGGRKRPYQTANGVVVGYQIVLESVSIQGITEMNVPASVIASDHPILLGMSFLKRVDMREKGNLMFLERRY
ncbi:TIGR02281 family clan AA aspartic protease [Sansalvadorimonas sp. 2012CJ34-2]|uniref:TIGR02281 family clan AA aspartic protease n=1 Tax=Parendozoicomonas callyspongiae TaxID=2942213 RepID=A0ABT0PKK1_9GAMM|nr:TIGR02281 family clan AA aspartic protease [Sansalvadorimonas sp. 2012CJ34-2]